MREVRFSVFPRDARSYDLRYFGTEGQLQGERRFETAAIDTFIADMEAPDGNPATNLAGLGKRLYEWLDGPTERWLARALEGTDSVSIHIDVAQRLRHLPWELLYGPAGHLCTLPTRPIGITRRHGEGHRADQRENRPLRVLLMACSATDVPPELNFEAEETLILKTSGRHQIELVVEESGTLEGLAEQVVEYGKGYFDVLHLTGHAGIDGNTPVFVMESDTGLAHYATAQEIAEAFSQRWPRLVFLSGCQTGQAVDAGVLPSLCEALVAAGAPAVLGWALPVYDSTASIAAAELYGHLAVGVALDEAVSRVRCELQKQNCPDWHLLRLYTDATPAGEFVTAPNTHGRTRLEVRPAATVFLDAGAKTEVCQREDFVGRRRNIQRCLRTLRSVATDDVYREGILLHGMGGLGKSSLAARICERLPRHRRVVNVGAMDEDGFRRLLIGRLESVEANQILEEKQLTLEQRLRKLLRGPLATDPALFVFDDFERNLDLVDGRAVLKPAAMGVLVPLLRAIRETASESRVIVTSRYTFPLPPPVSLFEEGLESVRGAELQKKCARLEVLSGATSVEPGLIDRATDLAEGNFRLLERLDKVLAAPAVDHEAILAAMETATIDFREDILLATLLQQQPRDCRRLLALLDVCFLPVDRHAVVAIAGDALVKAHLDRAAAIGLVESGLVTGTNTARYYVSGIVSPLIADEVTAAERVAACRNASKHLYTSWWVPREGGLLEALEIHRLAMIAQEAEIAAVIANAVATSWINRSAFRAAEALVSATLSLGEDYRLLGTLGWAEQVLGHSGTAAQHYDRALALCPPLGDPPDQSVGARHSANLHNRADLSAQQGDVAKAMALYEESLQLEEQIGSVRGKAATLHQMAVLWEQQGDVARAMALYEESLQLEEQIGNVQGKAATLHQMAGLWAQQGDVARAMALYGESLKLKEQIGDVQGKAATLHAMAVLWAQQGDVAKATALYEESLQLEEQIGDVRGKAATLHAMAALWAQQGDVAKAMALYEESLQLEEQIGNVQGKAATLHAMAVLWAQQGGVAKAMTLYEESLQLNEQIGDVKGKAATWAQMAGLAHGVEDTVRASALLRKAAEALASVRAWPVLVTVLSNLSVTDQEHAAAWLSQALWLALRVHVPLEGSVAPAGGLFQKLGEQHPAAPLVAASAAFLAATRGKDHPKQKEVLELASGMFAACAGARKIPEKEFAAWMEKEGLLDPQRFMPALDLALDALVGKDGWIFDRAAVSPSR